MEIKVSKMAEVQQVYRNSSCPVWLNRRIAEGCCADLLPSFACHSAKRSSSSGIHDPVLTGRPLMCVGIGILE